MSIVNVSDREMELLREVRLLRKALEDPAVRKRIEDTGSLIVANTPEQFGAQIKAEYDVYKRVVNEQKLTLD